MSLGRAARVALAAVAALAASACSTKTNTPGEVIVVLDTNLQPGKDIKTVRLEVSQSGQIDFATELQAGAGYLLSPSTFGVTTGSVTDAVTVRFSGWREDPATLELLVQQRNPPPPRIFREMTFSPPVGRVAELRMPLDFLCDGSAVLESGNAATLCATGQTCIHGKCASAQIDVDQLPAWDPASIYGGASDPSSGVCFDTVACFATGTGVEVDTQRCTFAAPAGLASFSVALVLPPGKTGICGPDACLVPLDAGKDWQLGDGRVSLPDAVCAQLRGEAWCVKTDGTQAFLSEADCTASGGKAFRTRDRAVAVAVTGSCPTKDATLPTCGPWSTVGTTWTQDAGAPDVGALSDASGDADARPDADAGTDASTDGADAHDAEASSDAPADVPSPDSAACANAGHCTDGVVDCDETDVDCGGATCGGCLPERACEGSGDCESGVCTTKVCACPDGMVLAPKSLVGSTYCIDSREVTNDQYAAWLAGSPATTGRAAECAWNQSFALSTPVPTGSGGLPVMGLDWCDAAAFCDDMGKHLCGGVGDDGRGVPTTSFSTGFNNASISEWFAACSRESSRTYPYQGVYSPGACNDSKLVTEPPGTRTTCEGGLSGLFDMSGNVAEWEASCDGISGSQDSCRVRGGSYLAATRFDLACAASRSLARSSSGATAPDVGFRCCKY